MSPKSLDPLSPRKEVASESTETMVPRNADTAKVLAQAQERLEASKEARSKTRRRLIFGSLLIGLAIFLVGAGYLLYTDSPAIKYKDFAYVGGKNDSVKVTKQLANDINKTLEQKAKKEKSTLNPIDETKKEIALWAALQEYAQETGVQCSSDDVQQYLRSEHKLSEKIGLEQYYTLNEKAGRPKHVVDFLDQSDCLEAKLKDKIITQREYTALTIRWDYFFKKNDDKKDEAAEDKIKTRFENDFMPLYRSGASKEEIAKRSDSSYLMTSEELVAVDRRDDGFLSSFNLYHNLLEAKDTGARFKEYPDQGESNYIQLEKLVKPGDYTPVFRSSTGYYAVFRLENIRPGKFKSYQDLVDTYMKKVQLSIGSEVRRQADHITQSIVAMIVTVAKAAEDCLTGTNHRITYFVRVENSVTGDAVEGLDLKAITDRTNRLCNPFDGVFEGDQAGISGGSFVGPGWYSQTVTDLIENGRQNVYGFESDAFALDCNGPPWRFMFQALPAGYTFSNAPGSVYGCHQNLYFCPQMTINHGTAFGQPYFDVPYSRGINGDFFTLVIKLDPDPPATPIYGVIGGKYDRSQPGNPNGQYSGARIRDDSVGDSTTAQPYVLGNRTQNGDHIIVAEGVADWTPTGWRLNAGNGHGQQTGNGNLYGFASGSIQPGATEVLDFFYEPYPSNIRAGMLIRDPNTGALSDPCSQSGYQNIPCSSGSNITLQRNFNLPGGLVNSYFSGPSSQTTSSGSTTFGSLYTGNYTATATGVPTGWKIVGTYQCGENADPNSCFPSNGAGMAANSNGIMPINISANRSRPVFYILQPNQLVVKGDKRGPGTFTNAQNSDTTNLGVGTIEVGGQTVSGNNQSGAWTSVLNFNPSSGGYGLRAVAPSGWQIRGYSFCVSAAALSSCSANDAVVAPNNQTSGSIILGGNDTTDYSLNIDYTNPDGQARFNGVVIPAGGQLWVSFYFKPAPVTIQIRGKIDMQGGGSTANTDLNPCGYNDYKRDICTQSELQAVRMNTAGLADTNNPNQVDIGNPAGGYGNCASKDYVPTKPGYDYGSSASTGFYCTTEGGNGNISQAKFITGNSPLRYGTTLDARTGGVSTNSNPVENNLAIVRNVYPGKYSFRMKGLPEYAGEAAYDVAQSTCAVGQADCSSGVAPNNNIAGCLLNHRRQAEFTAISTYWWWTVYTPIVAPYNPSALNDGSGQNYCTVMWSGAPGTDAWPRGGTPEQWTSATQRPEQCLLTNGYWAYNPQWNAGVGKYGVATNGSSPCGYRKDVEIAGPNTYSMGVPVGTGFREQTFYYSPKIKITNETLTCDSYEASVVYMPDPSRPVTTYYRIGPYGQPATTNLMRTDSSTGSDNMIVTTQTSGPNAYKVNVNIPKYNGQSGILLKDGDRRSFEVYARYSDSGNGSPDGDLVNGYSSPVRDWGSAGGSWKYAPVRLSSLTHQCRNNATCDQSSFDSQLSAIAVMDSEETESNKINVTMTNTGQSFWQQNVNENGAAITTGHQLVVTGGTILATGPQDTRGWYIAGPDYQMADGRQVYPIALNPTASSYTFTLQPTPPKDGGSKFAIGFQMRQYKPSTGYNEVFGTACEGQVEIKVGYRPWYRVQNGNVTALGEIRNQSESARGMYKAENRTGGSPYAGSVEDSAKPKTANAKPVINLHAQFVVAAERGGNNFCSTNFYMLGFAKVPATYAPQDANAQQKTRDCSFAGVDLNIAQAEDANGDGIKELKNGQLIATANNAYNDNGQCVDTGNNPEVDGGPYELSEPAKYYRSWASAPADVPSLTWGGESSPDGGDGPFGRHNSGPPSSRGLYLVNINNNPLKRPCPTIFKLTTPSNPSDQYVQGGYRKLGPFVYSAGRSTILSDQTIYINGDIRSAMPASLKYQFHRSGVPDMAGLNAIPNLGIISEGDIVVASHVKEIDASLYAKGKIITCDQYVPISGFNDDATKTDKFGTTGSKWIRRGAGIGLDSNPLSTETADPNVVEAPNDDNDSAKACSDQLRITGSVTGGEGFTLGRNFVDFGEMVARWRDNEGGAFANQSPLEFGKFCNISDVIGISRVCSLAGARKDFDSPGDTGTTYWLENKAGWPQNYYTGGPAEDFIGNGIASFMPPPGFENIGAASRSAKYYKNTARPKF